MCKYSIQIPNEKSLEKLKQFLVSKNKELRGPFVMSHIFPLYYSVDGDFDFTGWQDDSISGKSWKGTEYEETYNNGIPLEVLTNPKKYPEYYI